jgi:DNA-binding transcriptional LysR family regulator
MRRRFDHFTDIEAFHRTVVLNSFTGAAQALGTTVSVISRAITRLETRVGAQLLRRSTRHSQLTEAGQVYYDQTLSALQMIDDVEQSLREDSTDVRGRVKISIPSTWGQYAGLQQLANFQQLNPQVNLEIHMSNRNVDLIADGFDAAVRLGDLPDSRLIAAPIKSAQLMLVASPTYLRERGTPKTVHGLAKHDCIGFIRPSTGRIMAWPLIQNGKGIEWEPKAGISVADDVLACVTLAECSAGITQSYDFIVVEKIKQGLLEEVLPNTRGRSRIFSLIHASQRRTPAVLKALIMHLRSSN